MKNITRALALLLALVLVLGLVVTGFADAASGSSTDTKGKITINDAVVGQTYRIYRILELESYSRDNTEARNGAYSYKAASTEWGNFILGEGNEYFTVTDDSTAGNVAAGYVSWKGGTDDARVAAFAKAALAYATADVNGQPRIAADYTFTATTNTVVFNGNDDTGLPLGYYLLDSSLGTLCSLDTTNSEVTIKEKNDVPANEKKVQEDSKENEQDGGWTNTNDADIGQTVNFKSTITAQAGAQKYVFHDTMSAGLTFNGTVTVTKGANADAVADTNYTLITKDNTDENKRPTDGCTFEIVFNQTFCDSLKANEQIVIAYSATLNDQAVIGTKIDEEGNTNKSYLSYGEKSKTTESKTTTNTWKVDVFKFHTDTSNTSKGLAGATFTLKRNNETEAIKLVKVGETNTYRVAKTAEAGNAITEITTPDDGKFTIQGLDSDTYYLTEKEAPKGYNKLKDPIKIVIDENGNVKVNDATTAVTEVGVENKTGAEMPSTGGIGTTVFYVVGGILAVGAAVLLVTKKRMERG